MSRTHRYRIASSLAAIVALLIPCSVAATGALSQGFTTDATDLSVGSLMTLEQSQQNKVQTATSDQASQLVGVLAEKPLVELGNGTKQVQVVVSGQTDVLVSDINGTVKIGDKITASPVKGVGMKATASTQIVGTAQGNFASDNGTAHDITDKAGQTKQIHIGAIPVQVNVSYYAVSEDKLSSVVPGFLVTAGSAIAGKDVSPMRILIGFTCLFMGFLVGGIVLQAAVRSGIISLGRNPLAHNFLRQGLLDVMATTLGLLVVTIIIFYLVLTL